MLNFTYILFENSGILGIHSKCAIVHNGLDGRGSSSSIIARFVFQMIYYSNKLIFNFFPLQLKLMYIVKHKFFQKLKSRET